MARLPLSSQGQCGLCRISAFEFTRYFWLLAFLCVVGVSQVQM